LASERRCWSELSSKAIRRSGHKERSKRYSG